MELDAGGGKISEGLSEVDLSSPEDVKATIPDDSTGSSKELLVHFGESDFLERYNKYKAHLAEWRAQYPNLASVDMRYERQAVLEMLRGSAVPVSGTRVQWLRGKMMRGRWRACESEACHCNGEACWCRCEACGCGTKSAGVVTKPAVAAGQAPAAVVPPAAVVLRLRRLRGLRVQVRLLLLLRLRR